MRFEHLYPMLNALEATKGVAQREEYHPEGDVLNHSLQVFERAIRESRDIDLILAALLHDVGKVNGSLGHPEYALKLLEGHISPKTAWLIQHHIRYWDFALGIMKKHSKVQELATHPWLPDLVMLGRWDKAGRNPNKKMKYDREAMIESIQGLD